MNPDIRSIYLYLLSENIYGYLGIAKRINNCYAANKYKHGHPPGYEFPEWYQFIARHIYYPIKWRPEFGEIPRHDR